MTARGKKPSTVKDKLQTAGVILCACVMVLSGVMIGLHSTENTRQTEEFDRLTELVKRERDDKSGAAGETASNEGYSAVSPGYSELSAQNSDMVGWIEIEGTGLSYPVMHTPDEPDYYLKHNFEKQYSDYGVPYADAYCDVFLPSDNIIIYGHNIPGGKMFGVLENLKNPDFYGKYSVIRFDTLAGRGEYVILAVFETTVNSGRDFKYYDFVNAKDEDEFNAYITKCKDLSLYETGITATYGDKLLTLSTCENLGADKRLAIVAKKIIN